jgi:hypothetical protein
MQTIVIYIGNTKYVIEVADGVDIGKLTEELIAAMTKEENDKRVD